MAVSRMGTLCALIIILTVLVIQVLTNQPLSPSNTPKKWLIYIWDTPPTTSPKYFPSNRGLLDDGDDSMPFAGYYTRSFASIDDQSTATSTPSPNNGVALLRSNLTSWLSLLPRHLSFDFTFLGCKDVPTEDLTAAASLKAESPQKTYLQRLWDRNVQDHTQETEKEKARRRLDCAALIQKMRDEKDRSRASRVGYVSCTMNTLAFGEYDRRGCRYFAERTGQSQQSQISVSTISSPNPLDQVNSELPSIPATGNEPHLEPINRLAAEISRLLASILRSLIVAVIITPPTVFIIDMLAAYCDGEDLQPGRAAETVIEIFMVEEFYDMVVHAPCTHLRQKIMDFWACLNAWVPHWRVDKQEDHEYVAIAVSEGSARRQVQLWLRNLKKNAEKEPVLGEDGEWLLVDQNDAGDGDEEYVRW